MSGWTKLPAIHGKAYCSHGCGHREPLLDLSRSPHPGFGGVSLTRDGEYVDPWPDDDYEAGETRVGQEYEDAAAGDPDHDWRLHVDGPLADYTYQRQGEGQWMLVAQGKGFA